MFDAIFTEFDCFDFIESVQNEKENRLMVASEVKGLEFNLLEAHRREFYLEK